MKNHPIKNQKKKKFFIMNFNMIVILLIVTTFFSFPVIFRFFPLATAKYLNGRVIIRVEGNSLDAIERILNQKQLGAEYDSINWPIWGYVDITIDPKFRNELVQKLDQEGLVWRDRLMDQKNIE